MMDEFGMNEGLEDKRELDLQAPVHEEGKPEISDLSQKGYLYLKENRIADAEACFQKIIEIEPENNYALVGLETRRGNNRNSYRRSGITKSASCIIRETTTPSSVWRIVTRL